MRGKRQDLEKKGANPLGMAVSALPVCLVGSNEH
jgi:hypothetical protein